MCDSTMSGRASRNMGVCSSRQGWYAVVCLHVCCMLWLGLLKAFGVMLPTLTDQLDAKTWLVGWMVAIVNGAVNLVGPLSGPLDACFGIRIVVMASGFMCGVSMIVASLTTNVGQMTASLVFGVCGLGFSNILTRSMIGRCFQTNYATANGLATSGYSTGTLIIAPLTQLLLDTYGWRGTMMILGGICMHLSVCGALLPSISNSEPKNTDQYYPVSSTEGGSGDEASADETNKKSPVRAVRHPCIELAEYFGFSVCYRFSFWIVALMYICYRFVSDLWLIYFVPQAEAMGFTPYQAVTFVTAAGIANVVFKVAGGIIVDRGLLKLQSTLLWLIGLSTVTFLIVPWVTSYWVMMANTIFYYGSCGAVGSLIDIYVRELLGVDLMVSAFSWMEVITAFVTFSLGFFPGWTFDETGSYNWAFVVLGCIWALMMVSLLLEWAWRGRK